ncbi:MAG: redox-regulated ATPase YchF [Acidobacteria bacterium]|nr:redox-regulated ATPase YchF [Acidobacteriota bacterium]
MKCGIIGLPQAGKTTLFQILTRTTPQESHRHGEAQHIGTVMIPEKRLDRLARLFSSAKTVYPSIEYVDVAAIGKDTLKETGYLMNLRNMDGLVHVVRLFRNEAVPYAKGSLDPQRDIASVELDLILTDLGVVENRREKLEKDRKKIKNPDLEKEQELLQKVQQCLEAEKPLREADWTEEEKKRLRGFAFLSEKPMLVVLNIGEELEGGMDEVLRSTGLDQPRLRTRATVVCGKLEAEIATLPDAEMSEFLQGYGLADSATQRVIRATLDVMDQILFLTSGEKESRAWLAPKGATAAQAAGVIHSDMEKHFIRAEVVPWEKLLEAGDYAAARQKGILRLEGKEYVVQDGDVLIIRHTG